MDLKALGLNKFESNAYETLLRVGKGTAAQVSAASGVPYGRIYDVLESLVLKGLVKVTPEKPKTYTPESPTAIQDLIEKRVTELLELGKEVEKLKAAHETRPTEAVFVTKEKANFNRLIREAPESKQYSYSIKYSSEFKPEWTRDTTSGVKRGIDLKVLARYDAETKENVRKWLKIHKNIRPIHNEGVALSVQDDERVLIALIKTEVHVQIRDKAFAKLMKQLFLAYYEKAERIKP
ncbi:MAG: TrmB family transcriptional regulator [Candidatus Aenigmatarchaeota archaeon]|nr:MAG: TrmB family transcriptional regulator [Candidatus Aenigmarchaeota archaeon]